MWENELIKSEKYLRCSYSESYSLQKKKKDAFFVSLKLGHHRNGLFFYLGNSMKTPSEKKDEKNRIKHRPLPFKFADQQLKM